MELKPGYKQTEIGVIPDDWEIKSLGDLAHIRTGSRNNEDKVVDGEYPFFVRSEFVERINSFSHDCEAILVPGEGKIGEVFHYVNGRFDVHQRVYAITRLSPDVSGRFVHFYMKANFGAWAMQNTVKATVDSLRLPTFQNFLIGLPLLQEQSAIATALGDVDALLSAQDALIDKKRSIKQGTMQELLTGKRRLPGFSGTWEVKRLEDLAEIDPENLRANTANDYSFNYISLEDVDSGALRGHSEQIFATAPSRARRKLRVGDVLVSTVRPNLKSHLLFSEKDNDWVCSTGFSVVRCFTGLSHPSFVFMHLFSAGISSQIDALLSGSNYPAINSRDIKKLTIPVPPYKEQAAISEALSDMDAEITGLETQRAKIAQLKQGMMQELLTGRIRLV